MLRYSEFIDPLIGNGEMLKKLIPTESCDPESVIRIRVATDTEISGAKSIQKPEMFRLVRAALFYLCDELGESHRLAQETSGDAAAYWHGMIHRREGDFDNARYWFRRAGEQPVFADLHRAASEISADFARQTTWDPYLFTGLCEQERFGADGLREELLRLQRLEFDAFFDYAWRKSFSP